ncbi:hypothetical protein BASA81_000012 [Batrachochytrium salamandrivorans]|nr:hypothetical protein BASA81_000012 [Batrachochytrium salamandrivorans]
MRKTAEAETLLTAAQRGVARQEAKANPPQATSAATPGSSVPQQRAFTKEQEEGCRRILLCKTHYEALGIEKQSSQEEIKKSYRKLALRFHPDKCGAPKAEEAFKKLNKAFEVLSNEDDRAHYDRYGDADPRGGGGHGHHHHQHNPFQGQEMDVDDILRFFMQGGMGGGGMNFGGGRGFRPQAQRQQRGGGGGAGAEVQQISLQQILFFIVSMYFMFSSFGSPSTPQAAAKHQNNLYSLFPNQQYSVGRRTAMRGVVSDIPYYVEPRFGNSIGKSPKDLYYVETSVESAQQHLLSERCREEQKTQQPSPSSCVKLREFETKKRKSDIGRELAICLQRDLHCSVVLCDLDEHRLRETLACVEFARKSSPGTGKLALGASMYVLDLSSPSSVQDLVGIIIATHGKCDMVFNVLDLSNPEAPVSFSGLSLVDIHAKLQRELGLTISLCKLLLPILLRQTNPYLVNVSVQSQLHSVVSHACFSSFHSNPPPKQSAMSSLAVSGLSTTLQLEHPTTLRVVHATTLTPCSPKAVVAELLHNVLETRKHTIVLGQQAQILNWCIRLWPEFQFQSNQGKRSWLVWMIWMVSRVTMGRNTLIAFMVISSLNQIQAWLNQAVIRVARLH